ncbi:MAG: hypothetical protein E3K40_02140 [Candidatus Brocadia sp.]|nr:hypothetical protein [Candidatus Brocadia sp.]
MTRNKMFVLLAGALSFALLMFLSPAKGETMIDVGSAPTPYPEAAAFNQEYEFLGQHACANDGVFFSHDTEEWKAGEQIDVIWLLNTTTKRKFYPQGVYFRVYIDWNHDGDWNDPGEMAINSFKDETKGKYLAMLKGRRVTGFKDSFTVPVHTHEGPFWARAWVSYGYPSPVFGDISTAFGEIEDYNLLEGGEEMVRFKEF